MQIGSGFAFKSSLNVPYIYHFIMFKSWSKEKLYFSLLLSSFELQYIVIAYIQYNVIYIYDSLKNNSERYSQKN